MRGGCLRARASVLSGRAKRLAFQHMVKEGVTTWTTAWQHRHKGALQIPPDRGAGTLVVGRDMVESREERKGLRGKNWSICSEPSRAGVSNEPSRRDSKEMTWNNMLKRERVPVQMQTCRDHRTGGAITKLFSNTVIALQLQFYSKSKFQSFMSIKV